MPITNYNKYTILHISKIHSLLKITRPSLKKQRNENQQKKKDKRKKEAADLQKPQNIHHSYNQSLLPVTQISKVALDERTTRNRATIYPKRRRLTKKQEEKKG